MGFSSEDSNTWTSVSAWSLGGWLVFYGLLLLHAATDESGFLLVDYVNLVTHEAGHFFFGWFGGTISILGGTLGELLVPALIAAYFIRQRHTAGVAFAAFWFFENFLYVGAYMADARSQALPLVGSGEHDWEILFTEWGLLPYDRTIGTTTRVFGWLGMLASVAWFSWMSVRFRRRSG